VASLWNHPRYIEAQRRDVPWPLLTGQDLADIGGYLAMLPAPPKPAPAKPAPKPKSS
jgi:hypothetical protein